MKKKMLKPEIEFIEFNTQDVITTSGGGDGQVNFPYSSGTGVTPGDNSAANQQDWGTPTFNFGSIIQ